MTPPDDVDRADGFLARWSRRKALVRQGEVPAEPPPPAVAAVAPATMAAPAVAAPAVPAAPAEPQAPAVAAPTLDDVAVLTAESDFSRFVAPGVDGGVRNAALKKLFSDPHFNVMDGLDTYIDDYGKPDPLPEGMLRKMAQSQFLGLFTDEPERDEAADAARQTAADTDTDTVGGGDDDPALAAEPLHPTLDPLEPPIDENADLRLQPHDAPGRAGAEPGAGGDAGRQR
jgi:hypothetical protein